MKTRILLFSAAALLSLSACTKSEIPTYNDLTDTRFISFYNAETTASNVSFVLYPGQTSLKCPIVVSSTGYSTEDQTFSMAVVDSTTTATASDYVLPTEFVFHGGHTVDTVYVTVNYSEKLDTKADTLTLTLVKTKDFSLGYTGYLTSTIIVHNMVVQPKWWTSTVTTRIMGTYSEKKYRLFLEHGCNGVDLTDASMSTIRNYALIFKQWLKDQEAAGNTVYEANGTTKMTVAAGGN